MRLSSRVALIGNLVLCLACAGLAQNQPQLQISAPADGSIVNPGQTVSVTVISPAGTGMTSVGLIGEDPIGFSNLASAVPAQFSILIPSGFACRPYMLTAVGVTASGVTVQSAPIQLDVERPDMPVALSSQFQSYMMEAQGQTDPMMLLATFSDGSILNVTRSSNVTYQSANTNTATVDESGTTTAIGPGSTSITVTYNNPSGPNLQLSIPVTVLKPALTFSPAAPNLGNVNIGSSSNSAVTVTNATDSDSGLQIKSVSASGDFSETDNCVPSSPLGLGATCTVQLTFAPTAVGSRSGTLTVTNSASSIPSVIGLTGVGALPTPTITAISPIVTGPVGTPIVITGTNFGSTQGQGSGVTIGGIAAVPTSWSNTSISLNVPNGLPVGVFNVIVTANGSASNATSFNVSPGITGLSPTFGPVGTVVTVNGTSFGPSQGNSTISFCNGQVTPISWSDTAITISAPNSPDGSCTASVTVYYNVNQSMTNPAAPQFWFDLSPPSITGISPTYGTTGTLVTISGTDFGVGSTPGTVTFNGVTTTTFGYWTPTGIQVYVPSTATTGNVVVTSSHGVSSNPQQFVVTSPISFALSSASSTTQGLLQLASSPGAAGSIVSQDLINQPAGAYLVQGFDTQAGVPGTSTTWLAGFNANFSVTMQQVTGTPGTLFPEVQLFLNGPSGTPICTAIGASALTATQTTYSLGCAPSNNITVNPTDRYYLWVGVNSTAVSTASLQFQLYVGSGGRGRGNYGIVGVPFH